MIQINLKLFATLTDYIPECPEKFPVKKGITLNDLVIELKIPMNNVKLIFINGRKQDLDYLLKDGERVGLFPPVGGG